jgi:glycosyltransferase
VEYLVIDGGSTDGTLEKIEPDKEKLNYFVSEKDRGVYDALNKGIKNATGDLIGILHSDDLFNGPHTLSRIVDTFKNTEADLIYAKGFYVDSKNLNKIKRVYPSGTFKKHFLLYGWIPLHTTIFVRKTIFLKYGMYDVQYAIASDYEMSLRWFQNDEIRKHYLDQWVVKMRLGGVSTHARLQLKKSREDLKIIRLYGLPGYYTLACKIGRKIPQYLKPRLWPLIGGSHPALQK